MCTPEDGVAEILRAKEMGFKGVMMPGNPAVEDYDSTVYDKVWAAAVECDMPLSFHTLTGNRTASQARRAVRGSTASCPSFAAARM